MLIRSIAAILIVASSVVIAIGQKPDTEKDVNKLATTYTGPPYNKLRDIPFPAGVDLKFIIIELARDLDLNVLFDSDSFRTHGRKTLIDLKNVTAAAALDYILLQERLFFEEAGPRAIIIAVKAKQSSIPQLGVNITPIGGQLGQYFGVDRGLLINHIRDNSPAEKAGLKAGDVIVEADGGRVAGALAVSRVIDGKNEGDVLLTFFRDRKRQTIDVKPERGNGIDSVLRRNQDPGPPRPSK